MNKNSLASSITKLMQILASAPPEVATDPEWQEKVLSWVEDLPQGARPPELIRACARAFATSEQEILTRIISKGKSVPEFEDMVPTSGWLHDYVQLTMQTEAPAVFHFFAGAVAIGTMLARNVFWERGSGSNIFPNLCVVIVAPSGKCKKTSACNIATQILQLAGGAILADKLTPESLIQAFAEGGTATGLIYAPEMSVFLGKQKYNEGMVPLLTALYDCPQVWSSKTISRGDTQITNVAISQLACSTIDWIQTAIPKDAFGGGFMSRQLFVVQESTKRRFPRPPVLDKEKRGKLIDRLRKFSQIRGPFKMTPEAEEWYDHWYLTRDDQKGSENRHYAGYIERKPDHLIRLSEVLAISEEIEPLLLTRQRLEHALRILDWTEHYLPATFDAMQETTAGSDQMAIIGQLKKRQGVASHSELLRANARKMNAEVFRKYITTLRDAGLVEWDTVAKVYYLTPEGWK